ncbi:hypothetical protein Droror1_Dr00021876 [Drosera rotundifolia]
MMWMAAETRGRGEKRMTREEEEEEEEEERERRELKRGLRKERGLWRGKEANPDRSQLMDPRMVRSHSGAEHGDEVVRSDDAQPTTFHKDLSSLPRPLSATDLSSSPGSGSKVRVTYQGVPGSYSEDVGSEGCPVWEEEEDEVGRRGAEAVDSVAQFLESCGMIDEALKVATDPDYRFELAIQLGRLDIAIEIASKVQRESKWKQLGELAMSNGVGRISYVQRKAGIGRKMPLKCNGFEWLIVALFLNWRC